MAVISKKGILILTLIFLLGLFYISTYYYHNNKFIPLPSRTLKTIFHDQPKVDLKEETKVIEDGAWTINSLSRLGNQMGEYATLYALAKINRHPAYIVPEMFNYLAPLFRIRLPLLDSSAVKAMPWSYYLLDNWMTDDYKNIKGKYVMLTGTPSSWTFYHQFHDEILREFTFHDHIKNDANKYLETLKNSRKNVTYIGVHVRRGDYVNIMLNSWKGVVADKEYLDKAMSYFRNKYQEPVFVVTSNGMQWCKDNINNSRGDVYFAGDENESSPGRDLALLAHCNHTIMTIGTFGTWAAYLAGGEVIYLANYTMPDSIFLKIFRYEAGFLPEWIGIPADLSIHMEKKH